MTAYTLVLTNNIVPRFLRVHIQLVIIAQTERQDNKMFM